MDKAKQMFELATRLSKVNVKSLNEAQRTEYTAMVARLQEEIAKLKESNLERKDLGGGRTQYIRKSSSYTDDSGSGVASHTVHMPKRGVDDENEREYDFRDDDELKEAASQEDLEVLERLMHDAFAKGKNALGNALQGVLEMMTSEDLGESAPKGWEGTVKAMKKHKDEIDNPYALANYMKNKGYKSHKKESVEEGTEAYDRLKRVFDFSDYKG